MTTEAATSATDSHREQFTFQTEIKQLLKLLSHSLYQNREIAIRELLSNASDALNKLRFLQLSDESLRDESALEITLEPSETDKVLVIRDNGIGLTHQELIDNLGTIAKSGSLDFISKLSGEAKGDLSLIGQFGVGFYSAFMLADRVEVVTRSYKEVSGWRWESDGTGSFSIEPAPDAPRGAQVRLHLKDDALEFTKEFQLESIVKKYSAFISQPILLAGKQLNAQRPIWVEPKSQVTQDQYTGFYQWLTGRSTEEPLWHEHTSSDSPLQFNVILFCPATNFEKLGFGRMEHGLSLYAKRILIQSDNKDLLPEYLHFMYGIVDSADLPLNVSRETLQDNRLIPKLRKVLTKKVLDRLANLSQEEPANYTKFYDEFGSILRSGIATDFENKERIAKLLRLSSSHNPTKDVFTSLDEYRSRMRDDQEQIFYLGGPDIASLLRNPHFETFRKRNLEVLFLTDPVDEFALSHLSNYDGKELVSIDSSEAKLPPSTDAIADSEEVSGENESKTIAPAGFDRVLELFRQELGERVQEIRKSTRLTDSPCCLVNPSGSMSSQLQKVLSQNVKDFQLTKKILEVNPTSPLVTRLCQLTTNADNEAFIRQCGGQLYANAMLLDGMVTDPNETAARMQSFMEDLARNKSGIVL